MQVEKLRTFFTSVENVITNYQTGRIGDKTALDTILALVRELERGNNSGKSL
ncbi:MAG: hypothetical protein PT939_05040 [Aerococcus suis]|nr:hypothetical protein [Aerococcus suis]